jgi:pimeloyl-ACP methyl ester carboxylesterase/class 3 adenylate cyclase
VNSVVTHYARTADGDSIAYQVVGDGPLDIVYVPGFVSHVDLFWQDPSIAAFYNRLASFSRLILFDKRGTGLSDPIMSPQPFEERFKDVGVVMDAVGSQQAALIGLSEGCALATVYAATYPERVKALVLCGPILGGTAENHPAGSRWDVATATFLGSIDYWGEGRTLRLVAPSFPESNEQLGALERVSASPRMAREVVRMWFEIDLRGVLSSVTVPTLVLHRTDEIFPVEAAREFASMIPGARFVELPGVDHVPWFGGVDEYVGEIEEFLTGVRVHSRSSIRLATLLLTDLVQSTERAALIGDSAWRKMMARHDEIVRTHLRRFQGEEIKHTGDGFLAAFDGPARAIRCGWAIVRAVKSEIGVDIRTGLHTGEFEFTGDDVRGLAVHVAARVSALAGAGDVFVSGTVKELVLGSGIVFDDRGVHELKGLPDQWRIYAAVGEQ